MKAISRQAYTETIVCMDEKLKVIIEKLKIVLAGNSGISQDYLDRMKDLTIYIDYQDGILKARITNLEQPKVS